MSVGAPPAAEVVPPAAQAAQGARPADRITWRSKLRPNGPRQALFPI